MKRILLALFLVAVLCWGVGIPDIAAAVPDSSGLNYERNVQGGTVFLIGIAVVFVFWLVVTFGGGGRRS